MRVFGVKRIKCVNGDNCSNVDAHNGYSVAGHEFAKTQFERATRLSWERGMRRFRLVEVRSKKVGTRG